MRDFLVRFGSFPLRRNRDPLGEGSWTSEKLSLSFLRNGSSNLQVAVLEDGSAPTRKPRSRTVHDRCSNQQRHNVGFRNPANRL